MVRKMTILFPKIENKKALLHRDKVRKAVIQNFEITDYYLYFIITSLSCSKISHNNWCTIPYIFEIYAKKQNYVSENKAIKFEYDFMGDVCFIGEAFTELAPIDVIEVVFRFIWSLSEYHGMRIALRPGMDNVWNTLSIRLGYSIKFSNGFVEFIG